MQPLKPFDVQLQFHLLRHFYEPSQGYIQKLSEDLNLPADELYKQVHLPASKFHPLFAADPQALYLRIGETIQQQWQVINEAADKISYRIRFEEAQCKGGIGEDAVMHVKEANEMQLKQIQFKPRDNFLVQVLEVDELPNTLEMVIVVAQARQVITAFPGRWMPPLSEDVVREWIFLHKSDYYYTRPNYLL